MCSHVFVTLQTHIYLTHKYFFQLAWDPLPCVMGCHPATPFIRGPGTTMMELRGARKFVLKPLIALNVKLYY